jgi:hypothetical protein
MEMAVIEASIAKMKKCIDLVDNFGISVETAGSMAFGGKLLWEEQFCKPLRTGRHGDCERGMRLRPPESLSMYGLQE